MNNAYQKNYNCFIKGLNDHQGNHQETNPEQFAKKDSKPYWIVYQKYLNSTKVVCAVRNKVKACVIALDHENRVIRQIGG
jgi:hypothetical protein